MVGDLPDYWRDEQQSGSPADIPYLRLCHPSIMRIKLGNEYGFECCPSSP